jgi:hypothetical protein
MASLKEGSIHDPDQKTMHEPEKAGESYAVENPGEVFNQSEYRALGWYVQLAVAKYYVLERILT